MALSKESLNIHGDGPDSHTVIVNSHPSKLNKTHSLYKPLGSEVTPIRLPDSQCLIQPQVPLAKFTSFRVGGPAELYVAPRNLNDLQASLAWANHQGVNTTLLGAGTNLLVSDRGIPGLVICTRYLRNSTFNEDLGQITAAAGEPIARLAWQVAERGWSGLEWAVGIPGTVGGAVVMNAGAHTASVADILVDTCVLSSSGALDTLSPKQLGYTYRTSNLQGAKLFVTQATFQLTADCDPKRVLAQTSAHLEHRRTTQPYHLPSCGSVFRNPSPRAAGWLIEQAGLKGHQIGGAQVAQRHANFILNIGNATASDIFYLIQYVQHQVERQWSLWLYPEVKLLGEF
ncbi:MAG: UDP-N-acetylmuramate dehydrogenase [Elainellaceae cyanobacterium]